VISFYLWDCCIDSLRANRKSAEVVVPRQLWAWESPGCLWTCQARDPSRHPRLLYCFCCSVQALRSAVVEAMLGWNPFVLCFLLQIAIICPLTLPLSILIFLISNTAIWNIPARKYYGIARREKNWHIHDTFLHFAQSPGTDHFAVSLPNKECGCQLLIQLFKAPC